MRKKAPRGIWSALLVDTFFREYNEHRFVILKFEIGKEYTYCYYTAPYKAIAEKYMNLETEKPLLNGSIIQIEVDHKMSDNNIKYAYVRNLID